MKPQKVVELSSPGPIYYHAVNIHQEHKKLPVESTNLVKSGARDTHAPRNQRKDVVTFTAALLFLAVLATMLVSSQRKIPMLGDSATSLPFETVTRQKLVPSDMWGQVTAPFPSGAWWSNLAMSQGDQIVSALPYQYRIDGQKKFGGGLQVSYGPIRRTADKDAVIDWFGVDLCVRATAESTKHFIARSDELTVSRALLPPALYIRHVVYI
jgi:hypothetical protein